MKSPCFKRFQISKNSNLFYRRRHVTGIHFFGKLEISHPRNARLAGEAVLKWKFVTAFAGLILLLGICVIGIVYYLTGNALQRQVDLRSAAIAANLSDAAAGYVSRKNALELDALIAKYGRLDGVAYAYIQDPKGEIIATSLQPFPAELKESGSTADQRTFKARTTSVRGQSVYETRAPLLDGQLGAVHVGLWAETVQQDVRGTLLTIVGLIVLCLAVGIAISTMIASKTIRPLLELKSYSRRYKPGAVGYTRFLSIQ